jgi:hypothetical protein
MSYHPSDGTTVVLLSPFDEAVARQKQPLLDQVKEQHSVETSVFGNIFNRCSSLLNSCPTRNRGEASLSMWSTQYRSQYDRGETTITHTIEFTEPAFSKNHNDYDKHNIYDEEQGYVPTTAYESNLRYGVNQPSIQQQIASACTSGTIVTIIVLLLVRVIT